MIVLHADTGSRTRAAPGVRNVFDLPTVSQASGAATSPAAPGLLIMLRAGTRDAHARLEALPGMACLLSAGLTAESYVVALRGLHIFHSVMGRALDAWRRDLGLPDGDGLAALGADLEWFGAASPSPSADEANLEEAALAGLDLGGMAGALGALYVVEGSALGGRVIGRAVARSLGVTPGRGGDFFCRQSAEAARVRWLDFMTCLTRHGNALEHGHGQQAVRMALSTMTFFEQAMSRAEGPSNHGFAVASGYPVACSAAPATAMMPEAAAVDAVSAGF